MSPKERRKWYLLAFLRAGISFFDLAGILALGFVASSTTAFLSKGSDPSRIIEFAGLSLPAVTAKTLPWVAAAILVAFLSKALLALWLTRKMAYFVATIEARAARQIAENIFEGDIERVRSRSSHEVAYAIQFGSPAAFNSILNQAATILAEGSLFLFICLGFLLVNPIATVVAVFYFGAIAFTIQFFMGSLLKRTSALNKATTIEANGVLGDLIAVFREAATLGIRPYFIQKIYDARVSAASNLARQTYLKGMPRYIIEAALLVGLGLFVLSQALSGSIVDSAGAIGVFLSGGFRLTAALLPLQNAFLNLKSATPIADSAHEILAAQPLVSSISKSTGRSNRDENLLPASVEFQAVGFSYGGSTKTAIKDMSFRIEPGEQVAFIGPSGSGKSTLVDLIAGILTPTKGKIEVSAEGVVSVSVSYVPQKPGLVRGSVSNNVALGESAHKVLEEKVQDSLRRANLLEVIDALPGGISAEIGNYQDGLSGGQIQRLGLARALYTNPQLLILDEATSALDAESESKISEVLSRMKDKVTVVLIAHRLNTVQHADRVFLVDGGSIVDSGPFQELVRRNPSVERLVKLMNIQESEENNF